jgi:hypothetical protein
VPIAIRCERRVAREVSHPFSKVYASPQEGWMSRRVTPAPYNAWFRQENARQRRAVDAYDRATAVDG